MIIVVQFGREGMDEGRHVTEALCSAAMASDMKESLEQDKITLFEPDKCQLRF